MITVVLKTGKVDLFWNLISEDVFNVVLRGSSNCPITIPVYIFDNMLEHNKIEVYESEV